MATCEGHGDQAGQWQRANELRYWRGDREITPDKETVFYVKFDLPGDDDAFNMMACHTELIDDPYALNGGLD